MRVHTSVHTTYKMVVNGGKMTENEGNLKQVENRVYCVFEREKLYFAVNAALAQSVEQRTENPCVRSSILRGGINN